MKEEPIGMYRCSNCDDVWNFFPEDYEKMEDWPDICPLCTMPVSQMIHDVYQEGGVLGVMRQLYLRFI